MIASASFSELPRIYDLQLDHWGFERRNGETFPHMLERIRPSVAIWWRGNGVHDPLNGLFDNSIEGVGALNTFAEVPSPHTFFFTMSFDSTVEPNEARPAANDQWEPPIALEVFNPLRWITNFVGHPLVAIATAYSSLPFVAGGVDHLALFVEAMNFYLQSLGFPNHPVQGARIPRTDVLPFLVLPSISMGGGNRHAIGTSSNDFQHNDGIVNTPSMRGPRSAEIRAIADFPDTVAGIASALRAYWDLGINYTIDHADEIGVFTDPSTVSLQVTNRPAIVAKMNL
jgi:hypothetical protein